MGRLRGLGSHCRLDQATAHHGNEWQRSRSGFTRRLPFHSRNAGYRVPGACRHTGGVRPHSGVAERTRRRGGEARDHLARRGGVDQPGQLDQQARHIRAGGKTQLLGQVRRHQPRALAGDRFRPAYRTGHRGEQSLSRPRHAGPVVRIQRRGSACRSARCTTPSWRAAWTP